MASGSYALLRLVALTSLAPLAVWALYWSLRRFGVQSEAARRFFVFLTLAAASLPFVVILALLASFRGKGIVAGAFLLIALLPFLWASRGGEARSST